jgi:flavin-dependent dehydrogenase
MAVVVAGAGMAGLVAATRLRQLGRPVVVLEPGWRLEGEGIEHAETPATAVELALSLV